MSLKNDSRFTTLLELRIYSSRILGAKKLKKRIVAQNLKMKDLIKKI
jgi:hypothetical protein